MTRPPALDDEDAVASALPTTAYRAAFDPTQLGARFTLTVVDGPSAGLSCAIDGTRPNRALVGHSAACDLVLADETVSRRHLALEMVREGLRVVDLGSRNGTRIGGVRVADALIEADATIELGASRIRVTRERTAAVPALPTRSSFGRVVGASPEMRRLYPLFERLASSTIAVIIEGETGTGKEAAAEALHEEGPRAAAPFVVFDCTAVPPSLVEAELFGHERGAFTGAERAREGLFLQASGGTLFIDEIGELDPLMQPKLLRAIDRGEVRPLGGKRAIRADVRIIAATRRDLDREVAAGRFRDDLFHRLAVGRVELPPLRSRAGDVAVLAAHFWNELGGRPESLPPELLQRWETEAWPGNVRELRNAVARHLALGELATLSPTGLPAVAPPVPALAGPWLDTLVALPLGEARAQVVESFERAYIAKLLERTQGNVSRAAEAAGVARRYFHLLRAKLRTP